MCSKLTCVRCRMLGSIRTRDRPEKRDGMELHYRAVDDASQEDCVLLARWNNDPAIKHLFNRFPTPESHEYVFTADSFRKRERADSTAVQGETLFACVAGEPVGLATYEIDSPKLVSPSPATAWLALLIGTSSFRGCGLGKRMLVDLEARAARAGVRRAEIGVFAYNTRALEFFASRGYREFLRLPERAFWDGRQWEEVRSEKEI